MTTIHISMSSYLRLLGVGLLVWSIYYFRELVIIIVTAIVLASALEVPIRVLSKIRISRTWAVSLIYLLLAGLIATGALVLIPQIADDVAKFIATLPKILDSVRIFGRDLGFKDLSLQIQELSRDISKGQILTVIQSAFLGGQGLFQTTGVLIHAVINTVLILVLSFYLALEEKGVQRFLALIFPKVYESYVEDIWMRSQRKIGLWMQGQFLLAFIMGILVLIPLLIIDMPYATALAGLAFIGEFIPIVGLTLATIPALFIAYLSGGVKLLGVVAIIYFVVSQLENHVLYPRVMNKLVGVPSVIVIISLIVGFQVAGFWGIVLSVPIAAIIMELLSDIEKRK